MLFESTSYFNEKLSLFINGVDFSLVHLLLYSCPNLNSLTSGRHLEDEFSSPYLVLNSPGLGLES